MEKVSTLAFSVFLFWMALCQGQSRIMSKAEIESMADSILPTAVNELIDFLALPNDGNYPAQIQENLSWCKNTFSRLGFDTQILISKTVPHLYAERINPRAQKTILFYLQIDGQPVDTLHWEQPNPYKAVIKQQLQGDRWKIISEGNFSGALDHDLRIFARSASDSKGPAVAFITALKLLKEHEISIPYNVKVIMDFQEELGSPTLTNVVAKHKELFQTDAILIMDGTRHLSNLPTLTYGARGIATATIEVFGPKKALHSGQYGNFAPNPVFSAARLIASLKDEKGRVLIQGFYNGIQLSEDEKEKLNAVPEDLKKIKTRLGIAEPETVGDTYQEALQYPTLNIRGLKAAWVGKEVRTLIPAKTIIEIDMRLVPESDGKELMELLKNHIIGQGFHLVDSLPTDEERAVHNKIASFRYRLGSQPFRTSFDSPIASVLNNAMKRIFGSNYVNMRTTGGSQPMAPFVNTLKVPAVSVRIPNPDNNIHAPNENLRIGNFFEGIKTCLAILNEPF